MSPEQSKHIKCMFYIRQRKATNPIKMVSVLTIEVLELGQFSVLHEKLFIQLTDYGTNINRIAICIILLFY